MLVIGKYEILEQLGTGSMGIVYRARDRILEREVALKTIRTGSDIDSEVRERFFREARACARLVHPNIVVVYDLGEVDKTAYIAMELLSGVDFRQIIGVRTPLPLETKLELIGQVCDALAHAHRHGVIHRDIKPSNLFLVEQQRVKLLDFGIARLPSSHLTVAGTILGTPNYMAPEQILGRTSDGRADLFSAAVVFFEMLVYTHPFRSQLIPRRIVEDEPDSLFEHDSDIPAILERVLARGLAKDPNQRYCTADAFGADIRAVLDGLRQNASPSFSGIELPSERALQIADEPPEFSGSPVTEAKAPPPGEQADEWRLSEVLRLVPEFEDALDRNDSIGAQQALSELNAIVASDPRFIEAVRLCRTRLASLDPPVLSVRPILAQPAKAPEPRTTEVVHEESPAQMNLDATIQANATLVFRQAPEGAPSGTQTDGSNNATEPAPAEQASSSASPLTSPLPDAVKPASLNFRWDGRMRRVAAVAGGSGACLMLILALRPLFHPVPIEPSVATAVVKRRVVDVYEEPSTQGARITSLKHGDRVNLIRLPHSRDQEWVQVQFLSGQNVYPAGYVRLVELADWWSDKPQAALQLVENLGAGESGSEEDIRHELDGLHAIEVRFGNDVVSKKAALDGIQLELELARREKQGGEPIAVWQGRVHAAQASLTRIEDDPMWQAEVVQSRQRLASLLGSPASGDENSPRPLTRPVKTARQSIPAMLQTADKLRKQYQYDDAKRIVQEVLRVEPDNLEAQHLRDKIEKAKDLERSTIH